MPLAVPGHKKPKVVLQPAAAPAKAPQAAGPSSKAKVVLQPGAAPARAPQVAGPSSKAKLAEEGEVLGQEGVMHYRAVYHLADSPRRPHAGPQGPRKGGPAATVTHSLVAAQTFPAGGPDSC